MKKILTSIVLTISPILAQCDWNRDMSIDVLDIVPMVDCILYDCWNGTQCDWNGDGIINILDIIATVGCIINECAVFGCSDPIANSYNGNIDDGSCEYTDIDGNAFTSIVIGNQRWMVENIRVTHYRNGDPLPNVILDDEWMGLYVGAYSENPYFSDFVDTYGRIYNWYAVDDERGVCPEGWYVPSDEEWMELEVSQGMSLEVAQLEGYYRGTDEGGKLKEVGTTHWDEPNEGATNESGFTALPGGYRQGFNGWFMGVGSIGAFWSSTEGEVFIDWAMMRRLYYNYSQISRFDITKQNGMSVRCVRGAEDAIYGCTDPGACNYIPEANVDDLSCWYADEYYDCDGICLNDINSNGVCDEIEFSGCIDPGAINFNPEDLFDDGSCEYTDIDGNTFTSIVIGNQRWMVENLRVTHYRNGDEIPTGHSSDEWWDLPDAEMGAYAISGDDPNNADIYGNLYNWYAVDDERGVCPEGWYVPSDEEFMMLEVSQGMSLEVAQLEGSRGIDEGGKLKEVGTTHWDEPNEGATNESGFTALPGGMRGGDYTVLGDRGYFWTSTETEEYDLFVWAWYRHLAHDNSEVSRNWSGTKGMGLSVRCVRAIYGCTDLGACNYIPEANVDDLSCWYADEYYDCGGICLNDINSNGVCDEIEFSGCIDPGAINFNPEDLFDDGSCEYTDIDGNAFTSIVIGNQRWMVENLSVTHYRNGDAIPTGHSGGEWGGLGSGAYAIYDDDPNNADIYGNLYNWYAVHDSRNIAPSGWHVPSDEEWMELEMYLGMWLVEAEASGLRGTDEGGKLKAAGTIEAGDGLWYAPNEGATNESGFAALPGGGRTSNSGNYSGIGNSCVFWTSSDYYDIGWYRELDEDNSQVYRSWGLNRTGRSVRCVRNASY